MNSDTLNLFSVTEVELIYRNKVNPADRKTVTSAENAYTIFMMMWDMNKINLLEQCMIILLNRNNKCIGVSDISSGGVSTCIVDPKIVFATALKAASTAIVIAHNHPSGSLKPSSADIALTEQLKSAGKLLDISILDHLIITPESYFSFADQGLVL